MTVRLSLESPELVGRTGRGVRIAVVDSGIAAGHPHVGVIAGGICLTSDVETSDFSDTIGHGTAVAAAIREKVPDAELLGVKVFDRVLSTNSAILARAISWAADAGAQLVNLSLGTPNETHRATLEAALRYALARRVLVVAAVAHEGRPMFPGALHGALGVRMDPACPRDTLIVDDPESQQPRVAASGYPRPIPGVPPERNLYGISFAVANASGFVARLLEAHDVTPTADEILAMVAHR